MTAVLILTSLLLPHLISLTDLSANFENTPTPCLHSLSHSTTSTQLLMVTHPTLTLFYLPSHPIQRSCFPKKTSHFKSPASHGVSAPSPPKPSLFSPASLCSQVTPALGSYFQSPCPASFAPTTEPVAGTRAPYYQLTCAGKCNYVSRSNPRQSECCGATYTYRLLPRCVSPLCSNTSSSSKGNRVTLA